MPVVIHLMPRLGLIGALTWNASIRFFELVRLGRERWWWQMHRALRREFRDINPNQMVLNMRGPYHVGSLAYGETPAMSFMKILDTLQLPPGSQIVDLGSGRGVPCLTAAAHGYKALGLEYFAVYTERCTRIAELYGWPAEFLSGNFLGRPLPPAQLYFISATAFPEELRAQLHSLLQQVPESSWIVAQDWVLGPPFSLDRLQQLPASWGVSKICYHRRLP